MNTIQKYVDDVVPPQARDQYTQKTLDFAKGSPLAFSFLSTQATFSSLPLAIFASFAIATLLITLSTALITSLLLIGAALLFLLPILFVTASTATIVWAIGIACYVTFNWVLSLYSGSITQQQLHQIRDSSLSLKKEIDTNAQNEYGGYVDGVKQTGGQIQDNVQDKYGILRDRAANATDHVQQTVNGAKDSVFKNDGIVDGVKAKSNRLGNTVMDSPIKKDVY